MEISSKLKELRVEKKISQKQLADKLYTTPQNIAHYEKGRRQISLEQAISFFNKLGIDVAISNGQILEMSKGLMNCYKDRNGKIINDNDLLKHIDGDIDRVYAVADTLGFKANKGEIVWEIYPLSSFDLDEFEVVDFADLTEEEKLKIHE